MEGRFNFSTIVDGGRGSGKTTYIRGSVKDSLPGLWDIYPPRNMKRLVVDTIDHPAYRDIPKITTKQIPYWKTGTYRIFGAPHVIKEEIIPTILEHVQNACIVFEDAYKYIDSKLDKATSAFIIDTKQRNLDLFWMYHSWGFISPDLIRLSDVITIMKCGESPEVRKGYLGGNYQKCLEYQEAVNKGEKFGHRSVYIGT